MKVDALILGGGSSEKITLGKTPIRALLEIKGRPMLDYVVTALKVSPSINKIVLVIPSSSAQKNWGDRVKIVIGNGSITQNIQTGFSHLDQDKPVLTLSSDIPLITSQAVEDFLARCEKKQAQVYYPIIPREVVEEKFPGTKRTYVSLKEGSFTGGNLVLILPAVIKENAALVEKVFGLRKSPLGLARILGFKHILKFLARRLSLEEVERKVSVLIKARGCAIIAPYPEIGVDVDKDSDFELVKEILNTSRD